MSDQHTKSELSKEVLAPVDGVREDLVATAVKFLQNPKVQSSALAQKKAFLQRKGLTTEEIEVAVKRAGTPQVIGNQPAPVRAATDQGNQPAPVGGYHGNTVNQQQALAPYSQMPVEVSKWVKAREILAVVTMITGLSYAAYRLYKEFLYPWLFGIETGNKRLEKLEKIVAESVTNINTTLISIEETLGKQQDKLQMLSHDVNSKMGGDGSNVLQNKASISEIKTELTSLKGLLLNRRQFPAMPSTTPVLPSWQLASNSGDADSNNKGDSSATGVPKITFSSSPASIGSSQEGSNPGSPTRSNADLTVKTMEETEKTMSEISPDNINESEADKAKIKAEAEKDQRSDLKLIDGNDENGNMD